MEERTVEEMLQEERDPVTDEASDTADAGQAQDPDAGSDTQDAGDGTDNTEEDRTEKAEAEGSETETSEENEAAAGNSDCEESDGGKKGFFSKLKKGDKEKAALQEKVDSLEDRVKRQMAEFENFRRRTEKEKQQMFSMGERNVIEKMLPIVDNFERGLAAVPEEEKEGALASGMEMVYRQLLKQLEDLGVTPIEAVGQEFDPNLHNAVMQVESEEYPSGTVAQELQKGYKYRDTVIRYSMVAVVQ